MAKAEKYAKNVLMAYHRSQAWNCLEGMELVEAGDGQPSLCNDLPELFGNGGPAATSDRDIALRSTSVKVSYSSGDLVLSAFTKRCGPAPTEANRKILSATSAKALPR